MLIFDDINRKPLWILPKRCDEENFEINFKLNSAVESPAPVNEEKNIEALQRFGKYRYLI